MTEKINTTVVQYLEKGNSCNAHQLDGMQRE